MAITGVPGNPTFFLSISLERRADGDGRPGKRGDLWPLSVVACGGVRSGIGTFLTS
jgi:hypothetical protein